MNLYQATIGIDTVGTRLSNITRHVQDTVSQSGIITGLCLVFIQHTSASLIIQENADPAVLRDLESWMSELVPETRRWEHTEEGPDDMPAHVRSAITKTSENIPVCQGRLALGTWQGIYLWEHRSDAHTRNLLIHVQGVSD